MNGMELALRFWKEAGEPLFAREMPELFGRMTVGLAGEGSECFGYDDEISRDHDWGPGFALWLDREEMERRGNRARELYASLPEEFLGCRRVQSSGMSAGRVGVLETEAWYRHFLGLERPPESLREWRMMPEHGLAAAVNGSLFLDPGGKFSAFRRALLAYYPEDIRKKKLAARCALAAQAGQYNYSRCLRRGDRVAALLSLGHFLEEGQAAVFLLNRRYRPFYKWAHRAVAELPLLGQETAAIAESLAEHPLDGEESIELFCSLLVRELRLQELTEGSEDFLLVHAQRVQERIRDPELRRLHLMAE